MHPTNDRRSLYGRLFEYIKFKLNISLENPSSSAMSIGYMEDILTEILLRLPAKSVLRFKRVSKQWLSQISSPQFRCNHASRHGANPSPAGIFYDRFSLDNNDAFEFISFKSDRIIDDHIPSFNLMMKGISRSLRYKSACNGLILLKSVDNDDGRYYVANLTTNEFKAISTPINLPTSFKYVRETLAFDPYKSPHYKIVFLFVGHNLQDIQIMVYSSDSGICKPLRNTFSFSCNSTALHSQELFCNGILYWLDLSSTNMLRFDLNNESLTECPMPLQTLSQYQLYLLRHIRESQGTIQLIVRNLEENNAIEVYELKRDYLGWFLKYTVDITSTACKCHRINPNFSKGQYINMLHKYIVYGFLREEYEDEEFATSFEQLVSYNFSKNPPKEISWPLSSYDYVRSFHNQSDWTIIFPYIETLACL